MLVSNGLRNPPKRDLRFLLESAVKYVYVDEQLARQARLSIRLEFLKREVPSSIDSPNQIDFSPILGLESTAFVKAVWRVHGNLSESVHLSAGRVNDHEQSLEREAFLGFETAADIDAVNDLLVETYDVLLPFACLALGPSSAADMLDIATQRQDWTMSPQNTAS